MKYLKTYLTVLSLLGCIILFTKCSEKKEEPKSIVIKASLIPDISALSHSPQNSLILYGRELIINTSKYLQRSLDGNPIDSLSKEMRALVAYIKWAGRNAGKNLSRDGIKGKDVAFLQIAADPEKGLIIYQAKCKLCHGDNGQGLMLKDSLRYLYPPLWGKNSYAVSAGMYRLPKLASFIKYNITDGAPFNNLHVTDEEPWNLAAFV